MTLKIFMAAFIAACLLPAFLIFFEIVGVMRDQSRDEFYD